MKKIVALAFLTSMVISAIVCYRSEAHATIYRQLHAGNCVIMTHGTTTPGAIVVDFGTYGQIENRGSSNAELLCPITTDPTFDFALQTGTYSAIVSGYSNGQTPHGVVIQGCTTFYDATGYGGACGSASYEGANALYADTGLDVSGWTTNVRIGDSPWLYVNLYPAVGSSYNCLFNYFLKNT